VCICSISVSIVVIQYKCYTHLMNCLRALSAIMYPSNVSCITKIDTLIHHIHIKDAYTYVTHTVYLMNCLRALSAIMYPSSVVVEQVQAPLRIMP
jgi:hypothetical protein